MLVAFVMVDAIDEVINIDGVLDYSFQPRFLRKLAKLWWLKF